MTRRIAALVALSLLAVILSVGCSKRFSVSLSPTRNQAPTVRLTSGPVDTNEVCQPQTGLSCYSLLLHWVGFDPDGRVAYYLYAIDPPDQGDTTWIQTTAKEKVFTFQVNRATTRPDSLSLLQGYHVIVLRAIDDRGASSPTVYRAFFSWTTAPRVSVISPRPHLTGELLLPPSVRVKWEGNDDDALGYIKRPVQYKYLLLGPGNENSVIPGGMQAIISSRGSLIRRYYAPNFRAEDGWTTVSAETTTASFTHLVPGASYMFIVAAFDESGAYSPVFQLTTNILTFTVGYATVFGPKMTVYNDTFYYQYPGGGFNPNNEVQVDVPGGRLISMSWSATPPPGADIVSYQWMVDGDVYDERGRTDELTDLKHWSTPSANVTSAVFGPFESGDHYFYAQAEDNTGFKALATVHLRFVKASFTRPLLIVDDTRRPPDGFLNDGSLQATFGIWPAAAELDTFMYAVGGVPWKRAPEGYLSPPGILAGFDFDTVGTRTVSAESALPLAVLAQYQHVVWLEDFDGGKNIQTFTYPIDPMSLLTYMTSAGKVNTLIAYLQLGGEVWMVGGGASMSSLYKYNQTNNDLGNGSFIFTSFGGSSELALGRFMYNVPHWRSEIRVRSSLQLSATGNIVPSLGRFASQPGIYAGLPQSFDARTPASDPLPPLRTDALFFIKNYAAEYLNYPNTPSEPVQGDLGLDFIIDGFDDASSTAVAARWRSSDTLNTAVSTTLTTADGITSAGRAMRITTQGGGASDGDAVRLVFTNVRDYSGVTSIDWLMREPPAGHVASWRLRLFDADGRTVSAPIPATVVPGSFEPMSIPASALTLDPGSPTGFDRQHVTTIAFALDRGDAAATTDFDDLHAVTQSSATVLDTLMGIRTSFLPGAVPSPTMTIYHGHDLPRPFILTGFAPWSFKRSQCYQLFDFVLRRLWGIPRTTPAASITARHRAAPALRAAHAVPAAAATKPAAQGVRRGR